jgi:hypothetical protein
MSNLIFHFRLRVMCRAQCLNHKLTSLLRDLSGRVPEKDKKRIADALDNVSPVSFSSPDPFDAGFD